MNGKIKTLLVAFGTFLLSEKRSESITNKENLDKVTDSDLQNFLEEEGKKEKSSTFGEKAVGISFNPANSDEVHSCKSGFADLIDQMNDLRNNSENGEQKRLASVAITELQTSQMWAVKALTWKD